MNSLSKISRLRMSAIFIGAAMFMSSCSKEEAQAPEPRIDVGNSASSLRDGGGMMLYTPKMPETNGYACNGCFAEDWKSDYNFINAPSGTSTVTALWGDNSQAWITPLNSPSVTGKIITVSSNLTFNSDGDIDGNISSYAHAKITNLIPGKKYAITLLVSTARTATSKYSTWASLAISHNDKGKVDDFKVELSDRPAQWVTQVITFTAKDISANLGVASGLNGGLTFTNVFVPKDAIKKLD